MLRWLATYLLNNAVVQSMGVTQDRSDLLRHTDHDPTRCKFGYVGLNHGLTFNSAGPSCLTQVLYKTVKHAFVHKRVPDTQHLQIVRTVGLALGKAFTCLL